MTDPLDSLRRPPSSTEPRPEFRASVMREVAGALGAGETGEPTRDLHDPSDADPVEVTHDRPSTPPRARSVVLGTLAVAAAAAAIVVLVRINRDDSDPEPVDSVAPAAGSTAVPLTPGTTLAPALTDAQIAAAGLLSSTEVGDGYFAEVGTAFHLQAVGGPGAGAAACAPFVDTVFESPSRPASVAVRPFGKAGAALQQYVVVFPDRSGADAMMRSLADPAFPTCWSAIVTEAYTSLDSASGITDRTPQLPIAPRPLAAVGDDMVVLSTTGSFTFGGTVYADEGLVPFVQVGRAITWLNPNSAPTIEGGAGYPDARLESALATAVAHLRVAQGG